MRFKKLLLAVVTIASTFVVVPVVGDFFVEFARQRGAYDNPEAAMNSLLAGIVSVADFWWYPWFAGGVLGLTLGVWLYWLVHRLDARKLTKTQIFQSFEYEFENRRDDLARVLGFHGTQLSQRSDPLIEIVPKLYSLTLKMKEIGIDAPKMEGHFYGDQSRELQLWYSYVNLMCGLSQGGHYKQAKIDAKRMIEAWTIKAESPAPQLPQSTEQESQP